MQHAEDRLEHAPAAWRRPGAVFVMYAYRLVVASLVATPFAVMFGAATGGYPRRDAVLFDEGGLLFIEAIRRSNAAMPPVTMGALALLVIASFASIVPLAALIGALSARGRLTARDFGAFALRPVGTFALLFGAFAVAQAILGAIVMAIGGAISRRPSFDAPGADRVKLAFAIAAIVLVLVIGVVHDLARVTAVRDELGFRASLRRAWQTVKKSHVKVFGAWAARATLGALMLFAGLSIGSRLGVDTGAKVAAGFLVYQASVFGALFLRASWLASAIRHVDAARPVVNAVAEPEEPAVVEFAAPAVAEPAAEVVTEPEPAGHAEENRSNGAHPSAELDVAATEKSDPADNRSAEA